MSDFATAATVYGMLGVSLAIALVVVPRIIDRIQPWFERRVLHLDD